MLAHLKIVLSLLIIINEFSYAQQAVITDSTGRIIGYVGNDSIVHANINLDLPSVDTNTNSPLLFIIENPVPTEIELPELPQGYILNQSIIFSSDHTILGFISYDQTIRNYMSTIVLDFSSPTEIRDANQDVVATFNSQNGELRSANNNLILNYNSQTGELKDATEILIGSVDTNGCVRDSNNMIVGYCETNFRAYIGYYFFKLFLK